MEYAFFILILYVLVTILGVLLYEYRERRKALKVPVQLPILSDREKVQKLNEWMEPFGFAYEKRQNLFYSRVDSWQRDYGYGRIYDEAAAPLNMVIHCEPIYFEYDDKSWMIEFWKGQYGITTGAEVGMYYLPKAKTGENWNLQSPIYKCVEDEDMMSVRFVLWKKKQGLFIRRGYHWWLTGFRLGEFSNPGDLAMDIEINLRDVAMREAFWEGLKRAGYTDQEISYMGTRVWIHFEKPHTPQPVSATGFLAWVKQRENKRNCKLFCRITEGYVDVYDQIMAMKVRLPGLYRKMEWLLRARRSVNDK